MEVVEGLGAVHRRSDNETRQQQGRSPSSEQESEVASVAASLGAFRSGAFLQTSRVAEVRCVRGLRANVTQSVEGSASPARPRPFVLFTQREGVDVACSGAKHAMLGQEPVMSRLDKHLEALCAFLLGNVETRTRSTQQQQHLCACSTPRKLETTHRPCPSPVYCGCLVILAFQDCVPASARAITSPTRSLESLGGSR